jgi:RNA polymerase sigma-70 factor (ECF subfamily)
MRFVTVDMAQAAAAYPEAAAERELVQQARQKRPDAWARIYDQHYPAIFRYIRARITDKETAEDLAAVVFVEAIRRIGSYRSRGRPLLAWLYGIARNQVYFHLRTTKRRGEIAPTSSDNPDSVLSRRDDPAALIESWDIHHALSRLSREQQEVLVLRYFVGLSTPETAAVLGKHERAVYSLHARAIQALRKNLDLKFPHNQGPQRVVPGSQSNSHCERNEGRRA